MAKTKVQKPDKVLKDKHLEAAQTLVNDLIVREAVLGETLPTIDAVMEALFPPTVLDPIKAAAPYLAYTSWETAIYNIDLTGQRVQFEYKLHGSRYGRVRPALMREEKVFPLELLSLVDKVNQLRTEWGGVVAVLRMFIEMGTDMRTIRALFPAAMNLCPTFDWAGNGLLETAAKWSMPTGMPSWLSALRAAAGTAGRIPFAQQLPGPSYDFNLTFLDTEAIFHDVNIKLPALTVHV